MKKIYELKNQRASILADAEKLLNADDLTAHKAKMEEVKELNAKIEALEIQEGETNRFGEEKPTGMDSTTLDSKAYEKAFISAIRGGYNIKSGKGVEALAPLYKASNAMSESGGTPVGSDGGFLVPIDFNNKIQEIRRQMLDLSVYFGSENVSTLSGWRVVDTAPTTGYTLIDENGAIAKDAQPAFGKISYSVKKYGLIVPVSNELIADEAANLLSYLANWFAKKGVITENNLIKAQLDTLTASNLPTDAVAGLKSVLNKSLDPAISANAVIITNQDGFDYLDQLKAEDGRPILQPDPTTGTPLLFKSKPVVVVSNSFMATRTVTTAGATKGDYYPIYIGDFKQFATVFRRQPLELASTDIGGDAFTNDQTLVRGLTRLDVVKFDSAAAVKREIFVPAT